MLSLYIRGQAPVPADIFFAASDMVTEASLSDIAKLNAEGNAKPKPG
jgi:hypothetical protein